MKRVFIVHAWGENPQACWYPWASSELKNNGLEVFVPFMPDTETPVIEAWVSALAELVGEPDDQTYFIGHSIGCQTILRYLETIDTPVGGAVFVAGWFNLENLEDEESEAIAKPWIETSFSLEKVNRVLPKSILIISDNDPFGAFKENTERFSDLVSHTVVLPDAGHITGSQEPAILSQFENLISGS